MVIGQNGGVEIMRRRYFPRGCDEMGRDMVSSASLSLRESCPNLFREVHGGGDGSSVFRAIATSPDELARPAKLRKVLPK